MPDQEKPMPTDYGREKCFLVAAIVPGRYTEYEEPLAELEALVDTAGGLVVGRLTQRMDRPHSRSFLGKGKFADLVDAIQAAGADTVVIDDDLTPSQLSFIEEQTRRKVIDRSEVILDIFVGRARSHQARLQVELAQLQYELPRLVRKWTHLERLGGGIGTRGPGESQIESDRRMLRRKIARLRDELNRIEARKIREVGSRSDSFTACMVGYTNAGKSSLLNRITDADAFVENRLFATLDTLTRGVTLEDGTSFLLSDTVGFIRRLPHHLVASFHATLEEAAQADLLLHVIDAADPMALTHLRAVDETLRELDLYDKERIYILNKVDAVSDMGALQHLRSLTEPSLTVSAKTGDGVEALLAFLGTRATEGQRDVTLRISAGDGRRLALLNEIGQVRETRYEGDDAIVDVSLPLADLERLKRLPGSMEILPDDPA